MVVGAVERLVVTAGVLALLVIRALGLAVVVEKTDRAAENVLERLASHAPVTFRKFDDGGWNFTRLRYHREENRAGALDDPFGSAWNRDKLGLGKLRARPIRSC